MVLPHENTYYIRLSQHGIDDSRLNSNYYYDESNVKESNVYDSDWNRRFIRNIHATTTIIPTAFAAQNPGCSGNPHDDGESGNPHDFQSGPNGNPHGGGFHHGCPGGGNDQN